MQTIARHKGGFATVAALAAVVALAGVSSLRLARLQHETNVHSRVRRWIPLIVRYAKDNDLSPALVRRVIQAESGGDPSARSSRGAVGLMQITPIAEEEVLRRTDWPPGDLTEPAYNLQIGTRYLRLMLQRFDGDTHLALAAYNAGPTRIARLRREHPNLPPETLISRHAPRETQHYVRRILAHNPAGRGGS